ncbi:hypothetical protein J6590_059278 [Homalodisca vitripennis]|nr:hypothetical protein J6590_059278 [Homalodisca vitripennis]
MLSHASGLFTVVNAYSGNYKSQGCRQEYWCFRFQHTMSESLLVFVLSLLICSVGGADIVFQNPEDGSSGDSVLVFPQQTEDSVQKTEDSGDFLTVDVGTLPQWTLPAEYLQTSHAMIDAPVMDCPVGQARDWAGNCSPCGLTILQMLVTNWLLWWCGMLVMILGGGAGCQMMITNVIMAPSLPCPPGQQRDARGLCRPIFGR